MLDILVSIITVFCTLWVLSKWNKSKHKNMEQRDYYGEVLRNHNRNNK